MKKPEYCPECRIGLNTHEINVAYCQNCGMQWDADYDETDQCPECLEETDVEELEIFNGLCEDCSLDTED